MRERVLILIDHYLPGYKAGGPVRSVANMVELLKDRFEFLIITRDREYMEQIPFPDVKSDAWNEREGVWVYYASDASLSKRFFLERFRELAPSTVYINGIYSWRFSIQPLRALKSLEERPRVVVAPRGMLAPGAMGVKPLKKRLFLFGARILGLFRDTLFHATQDQEKEEVLRWIGAREVRVLPNLPPLPVKKEDPGIGKEPGKLSLISVARIAPEKNTLGLLKALMDQDEGELKLDLYGPIYDREYWEKCRQLIQRLPAGVRVEHFDGVPPDRMAETLRAYHAFILLTKGENHGHAILEALNAGRPVIISDRTPWTDLEEKGVGRVLKLGDQESVRQVLLEFLRMDEGPYRELVDQVRSTGVLSSDLEQLKEAYGKLVQKGRNDYI